jgi:AcrR family transcriptional regulator
MSQKFGTRRKKNKAETRRIIFDTAYKLFEEKGYQKVTMRELAARADYLSAF